MSYEAVLGMSFLAFVAIITFFINIKKTLNEEKKPIDLLNENIIRLNENIKNMAKSDEIRDRRITRHGEEIDELKKTVAVNTNRINQVENKIK